MADEKALASLEQPSHFKSVSRHCTIAQNAHLMAIIIRNKALSLGPRKYPYFNGDRHSPPKISENSDLRVIQVHPY